MRGYIAAAAIALMTTGSLAFEPADILAYHDGFDDGRPPLEGAAEPREDDLWVQSVEDGAYRYVNTTKSSAVRFIDLPSVPYAFGRDDSDGATPAARVSAVDAPDGGIGLLIGHPHSSNYALFAIGSNHRFIVLSKASGKLRRVADEENQAVLDDYNDIEIARDGGAFSFLVNGVEVTTFSDEDLAEAPVGLGVFGRGTFSFDDVWVRPSPEMTERIVAREDRCDLPYATPEARLVLGGFYESASLSTVTIAGQDEVTGTIEVHVEPGSAPIYAVLTSYDPMIYRFTGAVGRIEHAALVARTDTGVPMAGAIGLPADRVSFHSSSDCGRFDKIGEAGKARLRAGLGARHPVDAVFAAYDPAELALPEGAVTQAGALPPQGIDPAWEAALVKEALRFNPSGIVALTAADVVTPGTAEDYIVLPQQFGLAQLVAEGALEPAGYSTFRVLRPFARYPAGLAGAHRAKFIFPSGIDEPAGDPAHSEIVHEDPPRMDATGT